MAVKCKIRKHEALLDRIEAALEKDPLRTAFLEGALVGVTLIVAGGPVGGVVAPVAALTPPVIELISPKHKKLKEVV